MLVDQVGARKFRVSLCGQDSLGGDRYGRDRDLAHVADDDDPLPDLLPDGEAPGPIYLYERSLRALEVGESCDIAGAPIGITRTHLELPLRTALRGSLWRFEFDPDQARFVWQLVDHALRDPALECLVTV